MPPKSEADMARARLQARRSFTQTKANEKARVNARIEADQRRELERRLQAAEDDPNGNTTVTEAELEEYQRRSEAAGMANDLKALERLGDKRRPDDEADNDEDDDYDQPRRKAFAIEQQEPTQLSEDQQPQAAQIDAEHAASEAEAELHERKRQAELKKHNSIHSQRLSLPIYKKRAELLKTVRDHSVVVVEGETGSGKTTQLLQYLHEDGLHETLEKLEPKPDRNDQQGQQEQPTAAARRRRFICSQPRRLAATSVAARVAEEMGVRLGSTVGYKVRFDDRTSPDTEIIFMTDGMLLKELTDPTALETISVIMIDEAHERSLTTDVLLGVLREMLQARTKEQLRLIVASATIQVDRFRAFFSSPNPYAAPVPHLRIEGRTFPVDVLSTEEPVSDFVSAAAEATAQLHLERPLPGDVLIFLPGQDDIERCRQLLEEFAREMGEHARPMELVPVYANLPPKEQNRIHHATPEGHRKIVIATNIAETSITVNGIVYVVDSGLVKESYYDGGTRINELNVVTISQASAAQRAGRAGRTQRGECVRLYTDFEFHNEMSKESTPEILRSNLTSVVLLLKAIGIDDLLSFKLIDTPPASSFKDSVELLLRLGALDKKGQVTELGWKMAEFPLDPPLAKCLVVASQYKIADELAMIAAIVGADGSLFVTPSKPAPQRPAPPLEEQRKAILEHRDLLFSGGTSDLCGYAMALRVWLQNSCSYKWATAHSLNQKTLERARDQYGQITDTYNRLKIPWKKRVSTPGIPQDPNIETVEPLPIAAMDMAVTRCLCQGFFIQTARLDIMDKSSYVLSRDAHIRPDHRRPPSAPSRSFYGASSSSPTAHEHQQPLICTLNNTCYLSPKPEELREMNDKMLGRQREQAAAVLNITTSNPKRPVLPGCILFLQLRRTSAERPVLYHVANIPEENWIWQAADL